MKTELQMLEPTPLPETARSARIAIGAPIYNDMVEFLIDEAEYLDHLRFADWSQMLAKDLEYNVPLRLTRPTREHNKTVIRTVQHMHDDYGSIMLRVARLTDTNSAWGEDPPSRCRRMVSNIRVYKTDIPDTYKVQSYLLLTRSRFDSDEFDLLPCERHDLIRKEDGDYKLARREAILDQSVLGTPNLGIFL